MKEVRVQIPENKTDVIQDLIKRFNFNSSELVLTNTDHLFILYVEDNRTNSLLHEFKAIGVGDLFGEIIVSDMNLILSPKPDRPTIDKSPAANVEEIIANIKDSAVLSGNYLALVLLSAGLAATGLLYNSEVIIIGSMIVAPLLGPVALTSLGVLMPRRGLLQKGLSAEIIGITFTIAIGVITGLIVLKFSPASFKLNYQMTSRADPKQTVNIAFAILSGIAAGVIISKGESLSIVGVAIAASLAPPAANIGLYLALSLSNSYYYANALTTTLILLLNIFAINASCSLMFLFFGLPSKAGFSKRQTTQTKIRFTIMTIIVLSIFIILSILFYNFASFYNK